MDKNGKNKDVDSASPPKDNKKEGEANKGYAVYDNPALGGFARRDPEEMRELARKAGRANAGGTKRHFTRCINCQIRSTCPRAFEEAKKEREKGLRYMKEERKNVNIERLLNFSDEDARCVYELEGKYELQIQNLADAKAFVSADPRDLLSKILVTYRKLEVVVDADPSYTKLTNLLYLLMNIYRLKFGEKAFVLHANAGGVGSDGSMSLDVKKIMSEIRSLEDKRRREDEERIVQAEIVEPVSKKEKEESPLGSRGDVPKKANEDA